MASTLLNTALRNAQKLTGLHLTVVGQHDLLHNDGRPLIASTAQSHRTHAACDLGFDQRCVAHCRWHINNRLSSTSDPIVTRCWKGIREIATPIQWRGHHMAVLYAGTWRQPSKPTAGRELPTNWLSIWESLPTWEDQMLTTIGPVARILADGLAAQLAPLVFASRSESTLSTSIDGWLHINACLPVSLGDLSKYLGKSKSRTGTIIRELYHQPFALVLRQRRLEQACHLLSSTDMPIAAIARQVGYDDPAYFSRLFAAAYHLNPRAWREQTPRHAPFDKAAGT